MIEIHAVEPAERPWASRLVGEHFGLDRVVSRGVLHEVARLPALVAALDGEPIGLLVYRIDADECEVVALVAARQGLGAGTLLLEAVRALAQEAGCRRLWLVTTNDNLAAQGFYRACGWGLSAVHPGAVTRARALKPEIPLRSGDGVSIEDEIEFEMRIEDPRLSSRAVEEGSSTVGESA